jgi:hypothetical protein
LERGADQPARANIATAAIVVARVSLTATPGDDG